MADESQDIFGKIDAMLGKRAGFGGAASRLEDEFPLLTEVVTGNEPTEPEERPRPAADAMASPAAIAAAQPEAAHLDDVDIDRLAAALEARLSELFIRQQLRIEALVRRVVREELDRRADRD